MGDTRVHKSRELMDYVMAHPNVPFTIETLSKTLEWAPNSVSTVLGRMVYDFPQMLRVRRGVYMWAGIDKTQPQPTPTPAPAPIEKNRVWLLMGIATRDDGSALVKDDETGTLYTLKPFTF